MRVAIGGFVHETNTFHPLPTTLAIFRGPTGSWVEGQELLAQLTGTKSVLGGAIDVGREYEALRKRYPDSHRYLIAPSLVRLRLEAKWDPNTRKYETGAWLHGWVVQLQVSRISVGPCQPLMQKLNQHTYEMLQTKSGKEPAPRYAVVLRYGRSHEPWVESCRALP